MHKFYWTKAELKLTCVTEAATRNAFRIVVPVFSASRVWISSPLLTQGCLRTAVDLRVYLSGNYQRLYDREIYRIPYSGLLVGGILELGSNG